MPRFSRMPKGSWDTTGTYGTDVSDADLPDELRGRGIDEISISFRSVGYYQPKSMYGGPDGIGWPAEGDDERTLVKAVAYTEDRNPVQLTVEQQELFFNKYHAEIEKCDLDPSEDSREWDD